MAKEFKLPDLGEGIESGNVARVLVSEGDLVQADQTLLELETDKALIEVPSPHAGKVISIKVKQGDKVPVGTLLFTIEEDTDGEQALSEAEAPSEPEQPPEQPTEPEPIAEPEAPEPEAAAAPPPSPPEETAAPVPAAPSVRRMARELGVDLHQLRGTGSGGRITRDDVQAYVKGTMSAGPAAGEMVATTADLPDFSKWGETERVALNVVRKKTAEHMALAWGTIPHVTQFDKADVTELEAFRQRHKAEAEAKGGKLTPTVLILKAVVNALKAFPAFNASLDLKSEEMILKHYYNVGIAVDTERGLLVPVVKDVDRKDLFQLAAELSDIAERTRTGKVSPNDLQGGCFTITNLGTITGTGFTPIVNAPEVAIMGISRSQQEPIVRDGRIEVRLMMPICISYDHRAIDGADGARFTKHLVDSLENPEQMLLGG